MCLGLASEVAGPGEVWLSSQNRNYQNRMGPGSLAWLSSAVTVAASAPDLVLRDPRPHLAHIDRERYARLLARPPLPAPPEVHLVAPAVPVTDAAPTAPPRTRTPGTELRGRVQRFGDHVDTDAIIPGQFCHLTSPGELGEKAFHFVRPEFAARARAGQTVVVAGEGWGCGSSREQAVWALIGAGVRAIVAKSYSFILKRNLVNEGLAYFVVKDARFYELAQEGTELLVDPAAGTVVCLPGGETFQGESPRPLLRALQEEGGLIPAIGRHGPRVFETLCQPVETTTAPGDPGT
jgi:aconitate hydratase/homoaconitate hydratase